IGAVLGPVAGVMITDFFIVHKQHIDLNELYMDTKEKNTKNKYFGVNTAAYIATILGLIISISGQFIASIRVVSDISWLVGFVSAGIIYLLLKSFYTKRIARKAYEEET
ncbi:MAG: cytosine permease, partial [Tetragenococcus koreensis]|nr:cytosine permease [Tetragenococcus koreensis]